MTTAAAAPADDNLPKLAAIKNLLRTATPTRPLKGTRHPITYNIRIDPNDAFNEDFTVKKTPGVVRAEIGVSLDICL